MGKVLVRSGAEPKPDVPEHWRRMGDPSADVSGLNTKGRLVGRPFMSFGKKGNLWLQFS